MQRGKLKSIETNFAPYQHERYEMLKSYKRGTFYVNNGSGCFGSHWISGPSMWDFGWTKLH
jgi:hypothetical protein